MSIEIAELKYNSERVEMYTIYDHPLDFHEDYVVKKWIVDKEHEEPYQDDKFLIQSKELEVCRGILRGWNLTPMPRSAEDSLSIIETWI